MRRIIIFLLIAVIISLLIYFFEPFTGDNIFQLSAIILLILVEAIIIFSLITSKRNKKIIWLEERLEAWNSMSFNIKRAGDESFNEMPIGIILYDEDLIIKWSNGYAKNMFQSKLVDISLAKINESIYKALVNNEDLNTISAFSKKYDCISRKEHRLLYFFDVTEREDLRTHFLNSRPALAIIALDNLDDSLNAFDVSEKSNLRGEYLGEISDFAAKHKAYIQNYDNRSLVMLFSYQELEVMISEKFEILNNIREISVKNNIRVTVSIGIGCYDVSMTDLGAYAKHAIDLAEKRGGDQVVVNIEGQKIQFFGGKTNALEKNTKIQARVNALNLKDLAENASNCLIMSHIETDIDALGAQIGLLRMIKSSKKEVNIVIDPEKMGSTALKFYEQLLVKNNSDILKYCIKPEAALSKIGEDTLLVICDTQSPLIAFDSEVLEACQKLVIIDHHRAGDIAFLNPLMSYVEPYASSTVELVIEMCNFYNPGIIIEPEEATIMLGGIVVDTNDFTYRASYRTFDVASILKEFGADMIKVRMLMREESDRFLELYRYLNKVEVFLERFAIIKLPLNEISDRVMLSKIADEALKIEGMDATFTLGKLEDDKTGISARSFDVINVQLIMEELGGGGHLNSAACQISASLEETEKMLKEILNREFMEGDKKMKVILLEDLKGRGKKDDIIDVANGYGMFLITNKKACEATQENLNKLKAEKERRQNEEKMHYDINKKLKEEINGKRINLSIKVGADGKLFGGITSKMIADEFEAQTGIKIDKRKLEVDASINSLGIHMINVNLHKDIQAQFEAHVIKK